ncbi:hypothetical protein OR16_17786 [Cupriavidus basilensis OR16]|uniref:Large exoproteins involved in heme utilization or adhesion n=1 Tax=Cupriavidus basilensis OR16 TaxID=1127483 RepID=H1S6L9_9BURK|nr:hypothetical protein [Cupriavidus basilensis]EHP41680.1 hypothetical protein OR16_17786 [Cupriavidus basilensis OR16]
MRTKILAIAAGVVLSTSAFAGGFSYFDRPDDADIYSQTAISNDIYVRGFGFAWGDIHFRSESGAVVNSQQSARDNHVRIGPSTNSAFGGGNALFNAQGNIGVNISAGAGNGQSNQAALASIDASDVFASAQVFSSQKTGDNSMHMVGAANSASMGDNMLAGAKGNVGVNIAAGAGNLQSNALAASVNMGSGSRQPVGALAKATASNDQTTYGNDLSMCGCRPNNAATLNGGALANAVGNIGVNIAAGAGNAQSNGLAISTATH